MRHLMSMRRSAGGLLVEDRDAAAGCVGAGEVESGFEGDAHDAHGHGADDDAGGGEGGGDDVDGFGAGGEDEAGGDAELGEVDVRARGGDEAGCDWMTDNRVAVLIVPGAVLVKDGAGPENEQEDSALLPLAARFRTKRVWRSAPKSSQPEQLVPQILSPFSIHESVSAS